MRSARTLPKTIPQLPPVSLRASFLRVESLAESPDIGRPGRVAGTRELVLTDIPYIVPYRPTTAGIEILTVMHSAQRWPDGF